IQSDSDCGARVFTRDGFFFRGAVSPAGSPGIEVIHVGSTDVHVEAPFSGAIIAPTSTVYLNSTIHGLRSVVAKNVRIQSDARLNAMQDAQLPYPTQSVCTGEICCPSIETQLDEGYPVTCFDATSGAGASLAFSDPEERR